MAIEALGLFVQSVDQDGPNADLFGGAANALQGILEQTATDPLTQKRPIHGQPPNEDNRHGIGRIPSDSFRCIFPVNRTRRQGVITDHTPG